MYHRSKDKILSKIGYYNDQKGIMNRYLREVQNWNPHLEKSKKAILEGMIGKNRNKVIVLGSGWLLDIPLEELSSEFGEVWLADVYHPPQIVKKASQLSNVKFVQTELTGMAEQVYDATKVYRKTKFKTPVEEFKSQSPVDLNTYDYVISCNILDQLDIILMDYLREYNVYTGEEIEILVTKIQKCHLDSLPRKKTTLICDLEEWVMDAEEKVSNKRSLVNVSLPGIETMASWIWKFDTQMTYYPLCKTYFKVASLYF
ncbi:MAG: hypothetical protein HC905_21415 [Bacteroidales bacterium]|nr:hypothetical protein [Bacteroidales bacterium]